MRRGALGPACFELSSVSATSVASCSRRNHQRRPRAPEAHADPKRDGRCRRHLPRQRVPESTSKNPCTFKGSFRLPQQPHVSPFPRTALSATRAARAGDRGLARCVASPGQQYLSHWCNSGRPRPRARSQWRAMRVACERANVAHGQRERCEDLGGSGGVHTRNVDASQLH